MHDYFAGNFMWTGVDYLGESFWPFKGFGSGAIDITGHPKDTYYFYQSQWTDRPMLHLFPHWNWPGRNGQVIPVLAYTNCNSVELFLNGRSLGEKRLEFPAQGTSGGWNSYALPVVNATTNDLHLSWDVPYEPGELRAVGRRRNGGGACVASVRTAGAPAAIRLSPDQDTVTAAPGDVGLVRFEIVDSLGTVVPTAGDLVRFTVTGGSNAGAEAARLGLGAGIAGGLLSAASYAGTTLMARFAVPRYGAVQVLFLEALGGVAILGVGLTLAGYAPAPPPSGAAWRGLAGLTAGSVLAANILFFGAVKRIEAAPAAVAATVEPVVGTLLALVLFNQRLTPLGWLGLTMVVGGVAVGYWLEARRAPRLDPQL